MVLIYTQKSMQRPLKLNFLKKSNSYYSVQRAVELKLWGNEVLMSTSDAQSFMKKYVFVGFEEHFFDFFQNFPYYIEISEK